MKGRGGGRRVEGGRGGRGKEGVEGGRGGLGIEGVEGGRGGERGGEEGWAEVGGRCG